MRLLSVLIPTYNESGNIKKFVFDIKEMFHSYLPNYKYEIVIIDNCSSDGTKEIIEELCLSDSNIKAIFNINNFGSQRSGLYGLTQTSGDCVIKIAADFQEPIKIIPKFVQAWEQGYKIVIGIKNKSKESGIKFKFRSLYYKLIKKISSVEQIEHFTGFGLYDKDFIDVCRKLDDPFPYFRGIVAEFGGRRKEIPYTQEQRTSGKSKYNLPALYDYAMLGITTYSKIFLRLATVIGCIIGFLSIISGFLATILNFTFIKDVRLSSIIAFCLLFMLGAIQLIFIGILGEYVLNINTRSINRPLVIEEKRINL